MLRPTFSEIPLPRSRPSLGVMFWLGRREGLPVFAVAVGSVLTGSFATIAASTLSRPVTTAAIAASNATGAHVVGKAEGGQKDDGSALVRY